MVGGSTTNRGLSSSPTFGGSLLPCDIEQVYPQGYNSRGMSQFHTHPPSFHPLCGLFRIFRAQQFRPSSKKRVRDGIKSLYSSRASSMSRKALRCVLEPVLWQTIAFQQKVRYALREDLIRYDSGI